MRGRYRSTAELAPADVEDPTEVADTDQQSGRGPTPAGRRLGRAGRAMVAAATQAWVYFRAFRRTRPFWGGFWLALGGLVVLRFALTPVGIVVGAGGSSASGYLLGGGMVLLGLAAWAAPHYRTLLGIMGWMFALAAFIAANLGGFLIGSVLGVVGGSMIWGWGPRGSGNTAADDTPADDTAADEALDGGDDAPTS